MSIIRSNEVSLSDIIKESNLIVEVKFVKPYKEEVPVVSRDPKASKEPIPPFIKKGCLFKVKGVLKNDGKIKVPDTIQVPDENWRRFLSQHKERYADGVSKSFTVNEYPTEVKKVEKASILFLYHFQDTYELVARDAFESSEAREKIEMILGAS